MAKILKKVGERLSLRKVFGFLSVSVRKEMDEALREAFRNFPL